MNSKKTLYTFLIACCLLYSSCFVLPMMVNGGLFRIYAENDIHSRRFKRKRTLVYYKNLPKAIQNAAIQITNYDYKADFYLKVTSDSTFEKVKLERFNTYDSLGHNTLPLIRKGGHYFFINDVYFHDGTKSVKYLFQNDLYYTHNSRLDLRPIKKEDLWFPDLLIRDSIKFYRIDISKYLK